jgi:hypothetical protein
VTATIVDGRPAQVVASTAGRTVFQDHALLGRERLNIYIPLSFSTPFPSSSVRSCSGLGAGELMALLLIVVVVVVVWVACHIVLVQGEQ